MDKFGVETRQNELPGFVRNQLQGAATTASGLRRTQLANERTYLAWWRTGLTAFAVSIGTAKIVPAIGNGPRWAYSVLGAAFALIGLAFLSYGVFRHRQVEKSLNRSQSLSTDGRLLLGVSVAGLLLGLAILILILVST